MARGLMTALQAALAGVSGGAQGYAQYQRQQREEEARKAEMERQRLRDALAQSQFGLQQKEYEARYGPEAVARAERETEAERRFKAEQASADREAELERARISAGATASAERMRQAAEERDNEAAGLAYLSEIRNNPEAARALGAIFSSRPDLARRPGLAAYQLMSRAADREASQLRRAAAGLDDGGASAAPASSLAARQGAGQPMAGGSYGSTSGAPKTKEDRAREWMAANPIRPDESRSEYAARMRAAVGA